MSTFSEQDWRFLLQRVRDHKVTPFLGAGACYGLLPLGADIAREWAKSEGYPMQDEEDLVRVAQYLAVKYDSAYPKEAIQRKFIEAKGPDPKDLDDPHHVLASLPLPVYLTTNYDDFMVQALKRADKDPRRDFCRWSSLLRDRVDLPEVFAAEPKYEPTVANPLVFHMHGHLGPNHTESLVLTEDDYLEFLAGIARDPDVLPARVQNALQISTCLFIGYRLADWNFRVLFQGLRPTITRQQRQGYSVMLPPGGTEEFKANAMKYMEEYFDALNVKVYWGTARSFCSELRQRFAAAPK